MNQGLGETPSSSQRILKWGWPTTKSLGRAGLVLKDIAQQMLDLTAYNPFVFLPYDLA
jgi:hypothetical protein